MARSNSAPGSPPARIIPDNGRKLQVAPTSRAAAARNQGAAAPASSTISTRRFWGSRTPSSVPTSGFSSP